MRKKNKAVTIQEVAARANVSVATVSRVLNNNALVKSHLKRNVDKAIKELGYEYKPTSIGSKKSWEPYRIAIILPNIANPFHALLLKGISNSALVTGADILIYNCDESLQTEKQFFVHIAHSSVQGVIYIPFSQEIDPLVLELIEKEFPLVFLDRELDRDDICIVSSDNVEGAYQATTYLLNLGHRDIAFICGPAHFSTTSTRFEGFAKGLAEYGLGVRKELILNGDTSFEGAFKETQEFLSRKIPFTAIFASNDLMALGAWRAVEDAGLRVPDEVSIIGYDEIPLSSYVSLTTIAQPSFEVGRNSIMLLIDLIEHRRAPPQRILLRDSLIIRKSCRKL
jgi:LacI family transcriptional regulator